jgi:hypothetical protein
MQGIEADCDALLSLVCFTGCCCAQCVASTPALQINCLSPLTCHQRFYSYTVAGCHRPHVGLTGMLTAPQARGEQGGGVDDRYAHSPTGEGGAGWWG